ncbi:sulfate transport system substrate-binding protein [Arboricoccus pini]|uniref:Sulfate transport system substrate-binding protein n=1 Tax=Arboricoccus pini TaxID=1963835 RepID=A0A212QYK7_9PROT|nr:thiosulfate ABC transporter substrate-binding protein CysP [Arboricoccus pini]SNB64799.1 sulfate transport system substrate-binding protein [Arboricoccus pini]
MRRRHLAAGLASASALAALHFKQARAEVSTILNVSYDVGRELFTAIDIAFVKAWKTKTGQDIKVDQSYGGTSKQARAILEGLQADVVTFNQVTDIQILHDRGQLIPANWQSRLPYNSSPFYSLPAFLVRKGNPKAIKDWDDLTRDDVQPVFPNPKTSGNARYTYLAAFAYGLEHNGGDETKAEAFVAKLLGNVPVFDTGGRGSTTTFVEREIGDVLVTFEAEMHGVAREYGDAGFEIVLPSMSIEADFPVTLVDRVVDARGSRDVSSAYLEFLYQPEAQEIIAGFGNRVRDDEVAKAHAGDFPAVRLVTVEQVFGGWGRAESEHFADGGLFDRAFSPGRQR